jgi:hypothetical protein
MTDQKRSVGRPRLSDRPLSAAEKARRMRDARLADGLVRTKIWVPARLKQRLSAIADDENTSVEAIVNDVLAREYAK